MLARQSVLANLELGLEPITFASLRYGLAAMLVVAWLLLGKRRAARRSGFRTGVIPTIQLLFPSSGDQAGGTQVTVTGTEEKNGLKSPPVWRRYSRHSAVR